MEALFRDEMLSLQDTLANNWLYWKEVVKYVKVYTELFVILQDKLERCGFMFMTLESGAFSLNWRHSCNFNAISDVLPSCWLLYHQQGFHLYWTTY
jgi:hypothetical protein